MGLPRTEEGEGAHGAHRSEGRSHHVLRKRGRDRPQDDPTLGANATWRNALRPPRRGVGGAPSHGHPLICTLPARRTVPGITRETSSPRDIVPIRYGAYIYATCGDPARHPAVRASPLWRAR